MKTDMQIQTGVIVQLAFEPAGRPGEDRPAQQVDPQQIRAEIATALTKHARREAAHITIEVEGGLVTLRGKVGSVAERDAAIGTAFATPGVTSVEDRLEVTL